MTWRVAGLASLAIGLALKVIAAYVLVPLFAAIAGPPRRRWVVWTVVVLTPAALWYVHADAVLRGDEGSLASRDNRSIWLAALVPTALLRASTYLTAARYVVFRGFTPPGFALAAWGLAVLSRERRGARLWWIWLASAGAMLAVLAGKSHHEYYWLAPAPIVAVGVATALEAARERWGTGIGVGFLAAFLACCGVQSASTWRTPDEWRGLREAARLVRARVPAGRLVVAPEAILYYADRRGCRLEIGPAAERRAAGEWRGVPVGPGPLGLVEFYRSRGAGYFADLTADPAREVLHNAVRTRYRVLDDRPGILVVELVPGRDADDAH